MPTLRTDLPVNYTTHRETPAREPAGLEGCTRETSGREAPREEGARLQRAGDVHVLVLDDDAAIGRLIQAALAGQGLVIDVLPEPALVESQLQAQQYHLIILDYVLPGLDTATVMEWIAAHQPEASIIVVTAYPSIDSALHCLRSHTYDYLTKPFPVEHLKKTVVRCLESRGLLRLSEEALRDQLGSAIRERRKALRLTLASLAKRTGVSLGYLSQIELGKNSASVETLYKIALGLRMPIAELFQSAQAGK